MTLLEAISVRLYEPQNSHLVQLLFRQLDQGPADADKPDAASLFHSCSVPGDWTMQLIWLGNDLPKTKTALGRHLAESFRSIGLVHHTVWQAFPAAMFNSEQQAMRGGQDEV